MAKYLNIIAHQVQIPDGEKDIEKIYDLKFDKAFSLIQENLKSSKTERTMILVKQDRFIHWILGDLDGKGEYRGTGFHEKFMNDHHSVMDHRIKDFQDGNCPFAVSHINVFKTNCTEPAEHYIFFDLPEDTSDTRFIFNLIEEKAKARSILVQLDIVTTDCDKSKELAAIKVEMEKRLFDLPEFLGESILQQLALQEEQEAARLVAERARHRRLFPQANILRNILQRAREDEVSSSEEEDNPEVGDQEYNSENEYVPPWMLR